MADVFWYGAGVGYLTGAGTVLGLFWWMLWRDGLRQREVRDITRRDAP